ncbi:RecQ family ATP-dependent DNA helicase [Marinobacterium arenosum]|uniref:RecQ family ATP-dependent DNA helicase n=1 Tax=Marinobacterium arenosum TaxID=2862496 RepID=UPI001C94F4E3|nr:ATP-dependent DNA helicase RecQ [Marinobacterium arenosum]MBY4678594.1 RecQ family ATP-dependent DNA helicase [Marinobacterium arenosum]
MIHQTLHDHFGYPAFREGQEAVISAVVAGRSAAAIFPTGSGKSLCYQLPALHLPHLTLVVSPLLALMQDQLAFLQRHSIPAASIDSSQSREQAMEVMSGVSNGTIKILMISVERLKNERFRNFISQVPISLLVVDEAHCISEWGHNFRPDYLKLPEYQRQFGIPQALLLTATATPQVIEDIRAKFAIAEADVTITGFYRANLRLAVEPVVQADKDRRLLDWLAPRRQQASIVYVTLQQTAEAVAKTLQRQGIDARAYHAGMKSEQREQIQQQFMRGEVPCIVATIAFGMGIDKRDIRNVVHYDLPKSIENYSQEIGRAGRDGETSDCLVLANRDNLNVLQNFVYGDTPERDGIVAVLQELQATTQHSQQWELMLNALSQQSNIRPLPLKTLLVQLELRGILKPQYSYFAEYRFKYLIEPDQLVAQFDGERRSFVQAIVDCSQRARTWSTVDFDALYNHYGAERSRVVTALEYFQQKGYLELESKQMTEVYAVLNSRFDLDQLADELHGHFRQHEQSEIRRIDNMLALFESDRCLSRQLAGYFGDHSLEADCGHCSVCLGQIARLPDAAPLPPLETLSFSELCSPLIERHGGQPGADLLTRFLCGISAPALTRLRARSLPGFARLEQYPYAEVRSWLARQA